ncbi:hypothetical protein Zmor_007127 [Zophobas morio]|uniref:Uncharacterized protein n=1 Tax=Zophobas morio TaxID=2755281 RepID=A0AA38IV44_9CUCU|nr:hypothetical protein Zmor_007127 [Zophobas morio]
MLEKQLKQMAAMFAKMNEKMDASNKKMNEKIRARMVKMDARVETMDEKIKEVEKSVQEYMEDRIKIIEDRTEDKMNKFEKIIKITATTGSCNVTSFSRTIQPATYHGQTPWSWYKIQFEAAATANLWEEEQKATALLIVLRGAAVEILQTLSEEDISKYSVLTTALELRFGDKHLKEVLATRLKTRTQKVGESLQEFATDVKKWYFYHIPMHHRLFKRGL